MMRIQNVIDKMGRAYPSNPCDIKALSSGARASENAAKFLFWAIEAIWEGCDESFETEMAQAEAAIASIELHSRIW
jgi:hypothetical protein